MQVSEDDLKWAADEATKSAYDAIQSAFDSKGHNRSAYLTVAAQKLRDAKTFRGEANMAVLFPEGSVDD